MAGLSWSRLPVRTEVFAPGDAVAGKAAWHVANALAELCADRSTREALRGPWFAVLSGKAVAVSQRRVSPLWDIKPGPARPGCWPGSPGRRLPHLGEAWTMQVALDEGGLVRVAAGGAARPGPAAAGAQRLLPEPAATLYPPRAGAVPPADSAVVRAPFQPDEIAAALVGALRYARAGVAGRDRWPAARSSRPTRSAAGCSASPPVRTSTPCPDAEAVVAQLLRGQPGRAGPRADPGRARLRGPALAGGRRRPGAAGLPHQPEATGRRPGTRQSDRRGAGRDHGRHGSESREGGVLLLDQGAQAVLERGHPRAAAPGRPAARMRTASRPALRAPPIETVATGTPAGICTIDSSESIPSRYFSGTGTPITGSVVALATMPGRCAAPPAPAMMTRSPRPVARRARSRASPPGCGAPRRPDLVRDVELGQRLGGGLHRSASPSRCP